MKLLRTINTCIHEVFFIHSSPSLLSLNFLGFYSFDVVIVVIVVLVVEEEEMLQSIIEMLHSIIGAITGENNRILIRGTVVLMKKNVLDFTDFRLSIIDRVYELVGKGVVANFSETI